MKWKSFWILLCFLDKRQETGNITMEFDHGDESYDNNCFSFRLVFGLICLIGTCVDRCCKSKHKKRMFSFRFGFIFNSWDYLVRKAHKLTSPSGNPLIWNHPKQNLHNLPAPFSVALSCLFWLSSTQTSEPPAHWLRPRLTPSACSLGWLSAIHADMHSSGQH